MLPIEKIMGAAVRFSLSEAEVNQRCICQTNQLVVMFEVFSLVKQNRLFKICSSKAVSNYVQLFSRNAGDGACMYKRFSFSLSLFLLLN